MNQLLRQGQTVRAAASGGPITVGAYLGGGGQGEVYRAALAGADVALKWYFPAAATDTQRAALELLTRSGPPNARFLWPVELAVATDVPGFGYVMPLRDGRFKGIPDMMRREAEPTFRALARTGYQLADSFFTLHVGGLCYRDISFGNVFFDPDTGDTLISDNDNVVVNGAAEGGVLGTPRFMAPEIVRGERRPSTQTDLYSLSVLLFYLFMLHHPLEGAREQAIHCLDLPAMNKLYGGDPLFIFDPDTDANRPVPGEQDNAIIYWGLYPAFLRALFTRAFTAGLRDPDHGRVRESEWRAAMIRLADAIFPCSACGLENFYDADALRVQGGTPVPCWACAQAPALPPRIRIGAHVIALGPDAALYPHHLDAGRSYDLSAPAATISRHPSDPTRLGLRNETAGAWVATLPDGAIREVAPGRSVAVAHGLRLTFGATEGVVRDEG